MGITRKIGNVKVEHFSASSSIKMTVTTHDPVEQGGNETTDFDIWFDYGDFDDLREIMKDEGFPWTE